MAESIKLKEILHLMKLRVLLYGWPDTVCAYGTVRGTLPLLRRGFCTLVLSLCQSLQCGQDSVKLSDHAPFV